MPAIHGETAMRRIRAIGLKYLFLVLTLQGLSACSFPHFWMPMTGQVLDVNTGKPIAGAIVVATWEGDFPISFDASSTCYHAESAVTDKNGKFKIPGYVDAHILLLNRSPGVRAYKAGFIESRDQRGYPYPRGSERKGLYYLKKDKRSRHKRLEYLPTLLSIARCDDAGESKQAFYKFHKAIYQEALALATTPKEKRSIEPFKELVEGPEAPGSRRSQP